MATDWTLIRISEATKARLEAARASMMVGHEMGVRTLRADDRDRVSLDQVVNLLLDMRDKHARRRRASAVRRRSRRASAGDQVAGDLVAGDQVAGRPATSPAAGDAVEDPCDVF